MTHRKYLLEQELGRAGREQDQEYTETRFSPVGRVKKTEAR